MRKLLVLMLGLCLISPAVCVAQNKQLEKARKVEFKKKMKEYKAKNYELFGSSRSLDVALLTHYEKLNTLGDKAYEVVGVASNFKSKNVGHQMAINSACITYAQQAGSAVRGRVLSDMQGNADAPEIEFDKFYAAYERLIEKEIKGEMRESYSVIRSTGKNTYEMESYFIVDEDAASKARLRAMEAAAQETEMAQEYAKRIAVFVEEAFEIVQ